MCYPSCVRVTQDPGPRGAQSVTSHPHMVPCFVVEECPGALGARWRGSWLSLGTLQCPGCGCTYDIRTQGTPRPQHERHTDAWRPGRRADFEPVDVGGPWSSAPPTSSRWVCAAVQGLCSEQQEARAGAGRHGLRPVFGQSMSSEWFTFLNG